MPFYTGKTADGSDMEEFKGMYVSPCGKFWSSQPFNVAPKSGREQRRERRKYKNR